MHAVLEPNGIMKRVADWKFLKKPIFQEIEATLIKQEQLLNIEQQHSSLISILREVLQVFSCIQ